PWVILLTGPGAASYHEGREYASGRPECGDVRAVIVGAAAEDGRPGNEDVRARIPAKRRRLRGHAAVHFEIDRPLPDRIPQPPDFRQLRVEEGLAAEAGIDRHDEDEIEPVEDVIHHFGRRRGRQRDARRAAKLAALCAAPAQKWA